MLHQQMTESHGEMLSTQSKINLALSRSHCSYYQQITRVRGSTPLFSWLMFKGRCRDCQVKISKYYLLVELLMALVFLLASLVRLESGRELAVMILSAWLITASAIGLSNQWLSDVLTQGVLWAGPIAAQAQQSPLILQDAATGVLMGFITFYFLRWIAGIVLRKEALDMGDVLLSATLGDWVGPPSLPNTALIASYCDLTYVAVTKGGPAVLPPEPYLSLSGTATPYLQVLF